ncbi:MAG: hypothetical protein HY275_12895 [Gemmatimonadetes bacterium]|nr:hypothetical protein [Gemmatimonadota bacterium]
MARPVLLAVAGAALACRREPPDVTAVEARAIEHAALTTLFVEREHVRSIELWQGPLKDAPVLGALGAGAASDVTALDAPDSAQLAIGLPVHRVDPAALEAHFRAHADAWEAWFRRYPGGTGLVELGVPERDARDRTRARLVVARSCGEHCAAAWAVVVARDPDGTWHTASAKPLTLPKR